MPKSGWERFALLLDKCIEVSGDIVVQIKNYVTLSTGCRSLRRSDTEENEMNFTQDWFSHNIPGLESIVKLLPSNKDILEIGSFEGRSTCWFLENVLADDGTIFCIDTFSGSEEHKEM